MEFQALPVNNVSQEVVMLESVVDIHLLIVDSERPIQYASLLQLEAEWINFAFPTETSEWEEQLSCLKLNQRTTTSSDSRP